MQRAPRDVLPNQPKKERVSNPTPYPSAHMMTAAIIFWRVDHGVDGRSRGCTGFIPTGGGGGAAGLHVPPLRLKNGILRHARQSVGAHARLWVGMERWLLHWSRPNVTVSLLSPHPSPDIIIQTFPIGKRERGAGEREAARGFTLPRAVRAYVTAPLPSHHPSRVTVIQTFSIGNRERGVEER